jgi:MFS superfamily sulfate permease-like transporter
MVESAGGRSQVSQLATVAVVIAVLLFLTKPLSLLPNAVLASIVLLIGVKLIDIKGLKNIYQAKPREFALSVVTAATVIGVGVEQGILLAIVLSLLQHVRKSYQPNTGLVQHDPVEKWRIEKVTADGFIEPGIVMYWFGAGLFYANANHFSEEIRQIVNETRPKIHWLVVDTGTLSSIDYSAGLTIKELHHDLAGMNVVMVLARINDDLKKDLDKLGLTELFGKERMFYSREACLDAFRQAHSANSTGPNP